MALDQPLAAPLSAVLAERLEGFRELLVLERLSGGASQETYRIEAACETGTISLAMRRAPGGGGDERPEHYPGLAVEAALMQAAAAADVPEPEVLHVLTPDDGLGEGFIMQWLEGEALGARIARGAEFADLREHLAYDCGRILARIHAIDLDATGLRDQLEAVRPETFIEQTWERYRALPTPQPMIDYTARWLLEHAPRTPDMALVHNDFRNGNIMVDQDGVVAVLDWEIAHIGDPMRDLGWICTNSWRFGVAELPVGGFGSREDLFRGYQDASGRPVDPERVKFWEVFGSFWWAVGCLGMAEHYRTGPDKTVERPAIGRRSSECQVDCVNLLIPGPVSLLEPALLEPTTVSDDGHFQMPRSGELLISVRDFLRDDVMAATDGRTRFLARVAANSLDILERESRIGTRLADLERERLGALPLPVDADADLGELRWALVHALREGTMALTEPALIDYLRASVVNQVAIDQPRYSGLRVALAQQDPGR